jgi:putative transcriptional regulator
MNRKTSTSSTPASDEPSSDFAEMTHLGSNLSHHFLIAMPSLTDEHFNGTVVYLAEHSARGALGIVINRPMNLYLSEVFDKINLKLSDGELSSQVVMQGGPVQTDRGFVLHAPKGEWTSTLKTRGDVFLTSSKDILEACVHGLGPKKMLLALGCSSWGAGQLEDELARNAWLTVEASSEIVFDVPSEERFFRAYGALGTSKQSFLSPDAGHA